MHKKTATPWAPMASRQAMKKQAAHTGKVNFDVSHCYFKSTEVPLLL